MKFNLARVLAPLILPAACLLAVYVAIYQPGYLNNNYLAAFIFSQVLLAAVWKFRQRFFLLLMAVFLWAGAALPLQDAWTTGRWLVLAVGAIAGFVAYMKDRAHNFTAVHLMALFCVVAAIVSALSSSFPRQALLKAISLLLLFLYGAAGARLAVFGTAERFFSGLLAFCEGLTYFTAIAYLAFHVQLFGSANSLGAVMGVVVVPLLLWGILISDRVQVRQRRMFAFVLALFLLLFSVARAGIIAGPATCALLCLALRRYKLLVNGLVIALLLAFSAATVTYYQADDSDSAASLYLYKGHREEGILGSRRAPWDQTMAVIQEHPWFGSGFGTSVNREVTSREAGKFESAPQALREHGNSYLAIMEWVGLLGVLPFCMLLLLLVIQTARVYAHVWRVGIAHSAAVPIAMVISAGLLHAIFEDWLFAPGYYLCVLFWALAFSLSDFLPKKERASAPIRPEVRLVPGYASVAAHR